MSINFDNDMGPEAAEMIKRMFDVEAIDNRTALTKRSVVLQKQMTNLAKAAKQVATVELNKIGDRKEVGGIVYELDEAGWKKLPIGTTLR